MRKYRFGISGLCCLLLILYGCSSLDQSFEFVFMTDIHVQPEQRADQGYTAAIEAVNALNPDFVLTGGDLIMDALGQSFGRADSLYHLFNGLTVQFTMPVYHTIGNHEVFGWYERSGISPQHAEYGKRMYLNRLDYDQTYYSFDHKGWHFIVLDAIGYENHGHIGYVDSLQLQWLKADLDSLELDVPVAVSTHIPFFSVYNQMRNGSTAANGRGSVITNASEVMDAFEGTNLKLVLQGHLHAVEDIHYRDTHFITGGAVSGKWWEGPRDGFPEGFVVVKIKGKEFSWDYHTFGWEAEILNENE